MATHSGRATPWQLFHTGYGIALIASGTTTEELAPWKWREGGAVSLCNRHSNNIVILGLCKVRELKARTILSWSNVFGLVLARLI